MTLNEALKISGKENVIFKRKDWVQWIFLSPKFDLFYWVRTMQVATIHGRDIEADDWEVFRVGRSTFPQSHASLEQNKESRSESHPSPN